MEKLFFINYCVYAFVLSHMCEYATSIINVVYRTKIPRNGNNGCNYDWFAFSSKNVYLRLNKFLITHAHTRALIKYSKVVVFSSSFPSSSCVSPSKRLQCILPVQECRSFRNHIKMGDIFKHVYVMYCVYATSLFAFAVNAIRSLSEQ